MAFKVPRLLQPSPPLLVVTRMMSIANEKLLILRNIPIRHEKLRPVHIRHKSNIRFARMIESTSYQIHDPITTNTKTIRVEDLKDVSIFFREVRDGYQSRLREAVESPVRSLIGWREERESSEGVAVRHIGGAKQRFLGQNRGFVWNIFLCKHALAFPSRNSYFDEMTFIVAENLRVYHGRIHLAFDVALDLNLIRAVTKITLPVSSRQRAFGEQIMRVG